MPDQEFVHLHVHTEYSLLDGLSQIDRLVERAKGLNMRSLAITDHGTMFGVIDFYRACKAAGIKPIIGVEAYVARRSMRDRDPQLDKRAFHLLLLAKNQTGYKNLLKIASAAQLDGYYYRPRIDRDFLERHAEGLIATSGCLAAQIPSLVMEERDREARDLLDWYLRAFGKENFFLELQQHDIPELPIVNQWLVSTGKKDAVQLVATNDVHYVMEGDYSAHDTLLCIQTTSLKSDANRLKMSDNSYFLTAAQAMWSAFGHIRGGEALTNTLKIAEMCEVNLDDKQYHLPIFPVPDGHTSTSYLRHLCEKGLAWRFGTRKDEPELRQRLEHELSIIDMMGFNTYFLIVWDLCQYARHADIWWNVRGSGAGSLAAYCLGITSIDPIQNNLLFERFLNPGRVSMPDIDMDFPDDRRGEMIAYAARKYGEDKVAAIITFGTMGAKAAVRDVGRALGVELSVVNQAARLIPTEAKQKPLDDYVSANPELQELYDSHPQIHEIIDTAKALQGVSRHASTHAAGVIVGDKPLADYLPLHRITGTDPSGGALKQVTQFPMETCESIGLLKIDFLGLSTLTIMRKACELIERHRGIKYTMDNIPYRHEQVKDNPELTQMLNETFQLIGDADTVGVFQVEGGGMQQMLREMRPTKFEHIIAAISLYRPGPMDYIPMYNARMHGKEEVTYHHPKMEPILAETYGILVYQEQLMQVASDLFSYSLSDADLMRRAVSKKKEKDLLKHKEIFLEKGPENDVDAETAEKIFADIEFFANYGFNKCVVANTEIVDAKTGRLVCIGDIASGKAQVEETLTCDLDNLRLKPAKITALHENGVKPVYRLTTQLGRQIEATANHPFYTFNGWRTLGELKAGDQIAVPRRIPVEGKKEWTDHEVIVLGHLLAEGNLTNPCSVYYYTSDEAQWRDYVKNLEQFDNTVASTHRRRGMCDVYAKRVRRSHQAGVVTWIERLGLRGTTLYTKFIPDEVFELNDRQIALLIARMWEGDGHINARGRSLYYATSSERLAHQLQHLLLRLDIISHTRRVEFPYKDGRIGYQLFVTGNDNLRVFSDAIACHFASDERRETLRNLVILEAASFGTKDIVPLGVKEIIRLRKEANKTTWDNLYAETGIATREFHRTSSERKSGFAHATIARLAGYFDSDELRIYADNDIYWDKITSIEYVGEQPTYDLTIEGTHNFIANDLLVHNSHAADYAVICVQTAFLKRHYPEEYMTALLTVHRDDSTKIAHFLEECRRLSIPILPPDVNHSEMDFAIQNLPDGRRAIRFGLAAVKNAGVGPLQHILDARRDGGEFRDVEDFCRRVDLRIVQKRTLESLAKVGAFEAFGSRSQWVQSSVLDRMVSFSASYHKDREIGQMNMFGGTSSIEGEILGNLPHVEEVSLRELLSWEKELLGLYVSGRPVDKYKADLAQHNTHIIQELKDDPAAMHGKSAKIAGEVVSTRKIVTRDGKMMAVLQVEDWHDTAGSLEVVMFPRSWDKYGTDIEEGKILMFLGKFDASRNEPQIVCDKVVSDFSNFVPAVDAPTPTANDNSRSWVSAPDEPPPWVTGEAAQDDTPPDWAVDNAVPFPPVEAEAETGEPVKPEPSLQPEPVDAVAPKTQEAAAVSAPVPDPQLDSRDASKQERTPGPGDMGEADYWLMVHFLRSDDADKDRRRLKRVHGLLTQYPGRDRFTIVMESGERGMKLEFPSQRTSYSSELMRELESVVGADNVQVFRRPG